MVDNSFPAISTSPCRTPQVYALHVGNHSTEMMALDNLRTNIKPVRMPILPALLGPERADSSPRGSARLHVTLEERYEAVEDTIIQVDIADCSPPLHSSLSALSFAVQYTLNEDQAAALKAVADMLPIVGSQRPASSPVTLIHGVFGAGAYRVANGHSFDV